MYQKDKAQILTDIFQHRLKLESHKASIMNEKLKHESDLMFLMNFSLSNIKNSKQ
jgi:hypothetical protein